MYTTENHVIKVKGVAYTVSGYGHVSIQLDLNFYLI